VVDRVGAPYWVLLYQPSIRFSLWTSSKVLSLQHVIDYWSQYMVIYYIVRLQYLVTCICSFDSTLKLPPIFDTLEWFVNSEFHLTLFILPNFRLFGNLDDFQMCVSYWFQSICIFLNNKFKRIDIRDDWNVNISNGMNKIRNKLFFFLAVLNDLTLFVLN